MPLLTIFIVGVVHNYDGRGLVISVEVWQDCVSCVRVIVLRVVSVVCIYAMQL